MKSTVFPVVHLICLFACSGSQREASSMNDSAAIESTVTKSVDDFPVGDNFEDEHGGVGGEQLSIIADNLIMFSEIGSGEQTPLSTKTFAPQVLEKGKFQFLDGKPDYWYKIRLEDGKEGWVFGAYTSKQIPIDQNWQALYNDFAASVGLNPIEPNSSANVLVSNVLTDKFDGGSYLLLFDVQDGDFSTLTLVATDGSGKKTSEISMSGVFVWQEGNKKYILKDMSICFDVGGWIYDNGVQQLKTSQRCFLFGNGRITETTQQN